MMGIVKMMVMVIAVLPHYSLSQLPGGEPLNPRPPRPSGSTLGFTRPSITKPHFDCGIPWNNNNNNNNNNNRRITRQASTIDVVDPRIVPFPPQVGERGTEVIPPKPICGASVISDRFLITAATCVIDPSRPVVSVRLGELDITTDNENGSKPVDYAIQQIIVHPDFNPTSGVRYNDVALLQTVKQIEFNEYVFPYCLSTVTPSPGSLVTGAGFGHVNATHTAGHLQEADLRIVDSKKCQEAYRDSGQGGRLQQAYPSLLRDQDVLCAGHPGRGACKGDEGGPLFRVNSEGRRFLTGIISFTGPCDKENNILPGVYTNVAHHIPFINSVLYSGF